MVYFSRSYWAPLRGSPTKNSHLLPIPLTVMSDAPKEELETIVVSVPANHPSGQRCRAGFKFTTVAKPVRVTEEQKEAIEADPYLTVHKRHSRVWLESQGKKFTQKNVDKYAKKEIPVEDWQKAEIEGAEQVGHTSIPTKASQTSEDGGEGEGGSEGTGEGEGGSEDVKEPSVTSSHADVVKALEAKGLKAGTDFDTEATRNDLLALYKTL